MPDRTLKSSDAPVKAREPQAAKNRAAIELLDHWLADDSGYDESPWPRVAKAIEEHRLSDRSRLIG